jgi:hypothetical protein
MISIYDKLASSIFLSSDKNAVDLEHLRAVCRMNNIEFAKQRGLAVDYSIAGMEISDDDARMLERTMNVPEGWLDQQNTVVLNEVEVLEIRETNLSALLLSDKYEKDTAHFLMALLGKSVSHAIDFMFCSECEFFDNSSYFRAIEKELSLDVLTLDDENFSLPLF